LEQEKEQLKEAVSSIFVLINTLMEGHRKTANEIRGSMRLTMKNIQVTKHFVVTAIEDLRKAAEVILQVCTLVFSK
jgi:hypothetical protein